MADSQPERTDFAILVVGATRYVAERLDAAVAAAGIEDMRAPFGFVIRALYGSPLTLTGLAERRGARAGPARAAPADAAGVAGRPASQRRQPRGRPSRPRAEPQGRLDRRGPGRLRLERRGAEGGRHPPHPARGPARRRAEGRPD